MADNNGSVDAGNPSSTGNNDASNSGSNAGNSNNSGNVQASSPMVIPEAYRGEKSLSSFKTHEDFVKSYIESQKKMGNAVWLPGEKDDPTVKAEKMGKIYKALGRPDAADGYPLTKFEGNQDFTPEHLLQLQQWAHTNNLSQPQFEAAADYLINLHKGSFEAIEAETRADEEALKKEWGPDLYKRNSNLAHGAIRKLGGEGLAKLLSDRGLGSKKELVEIFAKVGARMLEDSSIDAGEVGGAMSKAEAQSKIDAVRANPNDLYHRKFAGKPGHKERVAEMNSWFQIVHS